MSRNHNVPQFNIEAHYAHVDKQFDQWLDKEHEKWLNEQEEAYYDRLQANHDNQPSDEAGTDNM